MNIGSERISEQSGVLYITYQSFFTNWCTIG